MPKVNRKRHIPPPPWLRRRWISGQLTARSATHEYTLHPRKGWRRVALREAVVEIGHGGNGRAQ